MNFVISVHAENLMARLLDMPEKLRASLMVAMRRLAISVQRSVKEDKLTGQVLNVRTGTLRRSINQEVIDTGPGIYAIIGTNVKYAAIHEYGFDGIVDVKAHARRIRAKSRMTRTGKVVKGKFTGDTAQVSAHQRHMKMPQRSFLRSTLREFTPRIRKELHEATLKVFQK